MRSRRLRISEPPKWRALVLSASREAGLTGALRMPVRIRLTFHAGTKRRAVDPDNHCKLVCDALVEAGLIADDRWPYVEELVLRGRPAGAGGPWTEVTIESVVG
jgi:Holliday junction resolvase RusA-like endonuclease